MKSVQIKDTDTVAQFPDDMTDEEIREALRQKFDPQKFQRSKMMLQQSNDKVEAVEPTLAESMGYKIGEGLSGLGMNPNRAHQVGDTISTLGGFIPGVGDAQAGSEFGQELQKGNYGMAGLAAAGMLPIVGDAAQKAGKTIKTWHGSPHDFDKFDMSKIGTGEGRQVYGHGLYLAQEKKVAESYSENLSGMKYDFDGMPPPEAGSMEQKVLDEVAFWQRSPKEQIDALKQDQIDWAERAKLDPEEAEYAEAVIKGSQKKIDILQKYADKPYEIKTRGKMYGVEFEATPDELVDWYEPLVNQPKPIRDKIEKLYKDIFSEDWENEYIQHTGKDFYETIKSGWAGSEWRGPKRASEFLLKNMGIKGIQYSDEFSRITGKETKNMVAFSDKLLKISEKYGIPLAAVTPLMLLQYDEENKNLDKSM